MTALAVRSGCGHRISGFFGIIAINIVVIRYKASARIFYRHIRHRGLHVCDFVVRNTNSDESGGDYEYGPYRLANKSDKIIY